MGASAHANCSQAVPVEQTHGLCLGRRLAEGSCFAEYLGLWTYLGGVLAKSKGRKPAIGWVLGFLFQFGGCIALLIMKPKIPPMTPEQKYEQQVRETAKHMKEREENWRRYFK